LGVVKTFTDSHAADAVSMAGTDDTGTHFGPLVTLQVLYLPLLHLLLLLFLLLEHH